MTARATLSMIAVAALLAGCGTGAGPLSEADRAALRAGSEEFVRAVRAANWDDLAALYTEDALLMPPNEDAVRGRAGIRAWMAAFPPVVDFSLTPETIAGAGDIAYVVGRYTFTLAVEGSPSDRGKYVEIHHRQPDGSWLMAVDIFNSDLPAPGN
jgi:uncharacterized protein (TIGR02246 family)